MLLRGFFIFVIFFFHSCSGTILLLGDGGDSSAWINNIPFESGTTIVYTWTNFAMRDFLLNFLLHLKDLDIKTFVIGALDEQTSAWLYEKAPQLDMTIPLLNLHSNLTVGSYGWNSHSFKLMAKYKFQSCVQMMDAGYGVFVSDTDVVFIQNPLEDIKRFPVPDILISTDFLRSGPLQEQFHSSLNIGIIALRPPAAGFLQHFYKTMINDPEFGKSLWDQSLFNEMIRKGQTPVAGEEYYLAWDKRIKIQALDAVDYSCGQVYHVQHLPQRLNRSGIAVHNTFQFGGTPGKRHRFREALLWKADPQEYYDIHYLTYTNDVPQNLIDKAAFSVEDHFELVNHQIVQLRSAWAIARSLGRKIVLPVFWVGFDRAWFVSFRGNGSNTGQFPGSDPLFTLPFNYVPADHIIDFEMLEKLDLLDEVREYSFSPHSSSAVLHAYFLGSGSSLDGDIQLKRYSTDEDIKQALGSKNTEFKHVHLNDVPTHAFRHFVDHEANNDFMELMRRLGGIWCCANQGHVWYDFMYGVYPHKDRHNRLYDHWYIKHGDN